MVFYFKIFTVFFLFAFRLAAVDIVALYSSSCDRVVGIPLDVDMFSVYFLNLDGRITQVPRYAITAMAMYPMHRIPIERVQHALKKSPGYFTIKTEYENRITLLVEGWPVQFYQDKISFLDNKGREVVIDRRSIWSVNITPTPKRKKIQEKISARYKFIHPYRQYDCKDRVYGNSRAKAFSIFPQEYISDSVIIKRRFDFLMDQHTILRNYLRVQKFYAVAEIYKNQTSLGYWFAVGSRHGSSKNRSSLVPILSNEYSSGPFGYQHILLTGSTPFNKLIHGDPQSLFTYALKADYFHFSYLYDPDFLLLGDDKYKWQQADFPKDGDKHVENNLIDFGLDFGPLSFSFYLGSAYHGLKSSKEFLSTQGRLTKTGIAYRNHLINTEILWGDSKVTAMTSNERKKIRNPTLKIVRYNLELDLWKQRSYSYSFIYRNVNYGTYSSKSYSNFAYTSYRWKHKYIFKGMLGHELHRIDKGQSSSFFTTGISANLIF